MISKIYFELKVKALVADTEWLLSVLLYIILLDYRVVFYY